MAKNWTDHGVEFLIAILRTLGDFNFTEVSSQQNFVVHMPWISGPGNEFKGSILGPVIYLLPAEKNDWQSAICDP